MSCGLGSFLLSCERLEHRNSGGLRTSRLALLALSVEVKNVFRRTTDHEEIKHWVESHGGRPTAVRAMDGEVGVVRFNFKPEAAPLQPISWNEFFTQFEQRKLAFVYEEEIPAGDEERYTKLVHRGS